MISWENQNFTRFLNCINSSWIINQSFFDWTGFQRPNCGVSGQYDISSVVPQQVFARYLVLQGYPDKIIRIKLFYLDKNKIIYQLFFIRIILIKKFSDNLIIQLYNKFLVSKIVF